MLKQYGSPLLLKVFTWRVVKVHHTGYCQPSLTQSWSGAGETWDGFMCQYLIVHSTWCCTIHIRIEVWHLCHSLHTHTHTLVLVFTTARTGFVAPIHGVSQQEATRLVVPLAAGTPAFSIAVWFPQCSGVLIDGLARPMRWGRWDTALSDGIRIFILDSWPHDSPPLCLVISRWLACEHNQCQTRVSALAPKRKITHVFTISDPAVQPSKSCNFHPSECQTCWLHT